MSQAYVRLTDRAIFKSRYHQWYLIDTCQRDRDRILVEGGAEKVLQFLFQGNSIDAACGKFQIRSQELTEFLRSLQADAVIDFQDDPVISTVKCFTVEPPLDSVNILLTNTCNLRCAHCYVSSGKPMIGEMEGDTWIRILQEARQLGIFELNVSGGEPTLHRDFLQVAEYIASVPTFNSNLNTNGIFLSRDHGNIVSRAFKSIQVSIDDSVAEKHDAFRGRMGSFVRSTETIAQLVERGVEVSIGFTLTRGNLEAVDDIVRLAEQLGVTTLNIGLVANIGRANLTALVKPVGPSSLHDDPFMEAVYWKMKELAARSSHVKLLLPFRIPTQDTLVESRQKRFICDGDNTQILYIMANGSMMPCDKLPADSFSYGNVKEHSLLDVWLSHQMQGFKLMSPQQLPKCSSCPHLKICGGACVARAHQMGGSLDAPDWTSCVIAQKLSQDLVVQES